MERLVLLRRLDLRGASIVTLFSMTRALPRRGIGLHDTWSLRGLFRPHCATLAQANEESRRSYSP